MLRTDMCRDLCLGTVLASVSHSEAEVAGVEDQRPDLVTAVHAARHCEQLYLKC